jgi:hypothetical protein
MKSLCLAAIIAVLGALPLAAPHHSAAVGEHHASAIQVATVSHGLRITLTVPRTTYYRHALAVVTVAIQNLSQHPLDLVHQQCLLWQNPTVETVRADGSVAPPFGLQLLTPPPAHRPFTSPWPQASASCSGSMWSSKPPLCEGWWNCSGVLPLLTCAPHQCCSSCGVVRAGDRTSALAPRSARCAMYRCDPGAQCRGRLSMSCRLSASSGTPPGRCITCGRGRGPEVDGLSLGVGGWYAGGWRWAG